MTLKDGYGFGGFSGTPPSEPNLSTPPPPPGGFINVRLNRSCINYMYGATFKPYISRTMLKMITDNIYLTSRFLGPYGFAGVQISPPGEHNEVLNPWRPWYESYQPVSYELTSRRGDESAFRDMVTRCPRCRCADLRGRRHQSHDGRWGNNEDHPPPPRGGGGGVGQYAIKARQNMILTLFELFFFFLRWWEI